MKFYESPKFVIREFMLEDIVRTSTGGFDNENDNIFDWKNGFTNS